MIRIKRLIYFFLLFLTGLDLFLKSNTQYVENYGYILGSIDVLIWTYLFFLFITFLLFRNEALLLFLASFSNIYDRIFLGYVRDYIDLKLFWINISDLLIISVLGYIIFRIIYDRKDN